MVTINHAPSQGHPHWCVRAPRHPSHRDTTTRQGRTRGSSRCVCVWAVCGWQRDRDCLQIGVPGCMFGMGPGVHKTTPRASQAFNSPKSTRGPHPHICVHARQKHLDDRRGEGTKRGKNCAAKRRRANGRWRWRWLLSQTVLGVVDAAFLNHRCNASLARHVVAFTAREG